MPNFFRLLSRMFLLLLLFWRTVDTRIFLRNRFGRDCQGSLHLVAKKNYRTRREAADDRGNLVRPISLERGRGVKSKISPARLKCHSVNHVVMIDCLRNRLRASR